MRRRHVIIAAVLAASCGRRNFDPIATLDAPITMPIANVGNDVRASNEDFGTTIALSVATTGQDHLLVIGATWCCDSSGSGRPAITDDRLNTWQQAGVAGSDSHGNNATIFYSTGPQAGVTTISIVPGTLPLKFLSVIFSEYANVDLADPLDGFVAGVQPDPETIGDAGPITPRQPGDLITLVGNNDIDTIPAVAGPSFTLITPGFGTDRCVTTSCQGISMEYEVDVDTAPTHGTMQWQTPYDLVVAMAAFNPSRESSRRRPPVGDPLEQTRRSRSSR